MKQNVIAILTIGAVTAVLNGQARADVVLSGPDSNDGTYSTSQLAGTATGTDTVSSGGYTGISVWGLLGGSTTGSTTLNGDGSTTITYGGITTNTPAGDNTNNPILRYYLVGIGAGGQQSVVSLGEVDPFFGGTSATPAFIAYQNTGSGLLASPSLIVPGQPGRTLDNLTGLELLAVPALTNPGEGILSTAVALSGNVAKPGSYSLGNLENEFTPVQAAAGGDTYTGVPLWTFLGQSSSSPASQIAVAQATDGYQVVVALGELDPTDGGNPNDLLAYADTESKFPADGVARLTFPGDNHAGRYDSNLDAITVESAIPEPASLTFFGTAILALGALRRRSNVVTCRE